MENKIKAIIAEDVEAYLQTIEMLIGEVAPEITIAGKASSLAEADRVIREVKPDLLFLDIQFEEEGATVFDLLRAPWYHPTLAEILTYPLEEIAEQIGTT